MSARLGDAGGHDLDGDAAEEAEHVLVHAAPLGPQLERPDRVLERLRR